MYIITIVFSVPKANPPILFILFKIGKSNTKFKTDFKINIITNELGGERIDLVKYKENPEEFIASALAPAQVISTIIDEEVPNTCKVIVPENQLSLAIGNHGQNVRLAARLTGYKIDIHPENAEI